MGMKLQCEGRKKGGKSMKITRKPHIDGEIVQSIKANMKRGSTAEAKGNRLAASRLTGGNTAADVHDCRF